MLNSKKYGVSLSIRYRPAHPRSELTHPSAYLISIAVANKVKAKFYDEDLPILEDVSSALFPSGPLP